MRNCPIYYRFLKKTSKFIWNIIPVFIVIFCHCVRPPTNSLHTRQQAGSPWNHSYTLKLADSYNFAGRYLIIWGMFLKKKYEELLTYLPNQTWYTSEFVICARHLISPLYYSTTPLRKILNFRYKSQDIPTYWSDLVIVVINVNRLTDWKIRNSLVKKRPIDIGNEWARGNPIAKSVSLAKVFTRKRWLAKLRVNFFL